MSVSFQMKVFSFWSGMILVCCSSDCDVSFFTQLWLQMSQTARPHRCVCVCVVVRRCQRVCELLLHQALIAVGGRGAQERGAQWQRGSGRSFLCCSQTCWRRHFFQLTEGLWEIWAGAAESVLDRYQRIMHFKFEQRKKSSLYIKNDPVEGNGRCFTVYLSIVSDGLLFLNQHWRL